MEPPFFGGGNTTREEALRWLAIAEKLLTARDLVGSKSFATRARESDPNLIPAYQILAVVDTLIASEKRINNQLDWYAILQLAPSQDSELIATQYRRLAILLNPQKNKLPFSDQAFRLVVEAWSVLSNPSRKRAYDAQVNFHFYSPPNPNPNPIPAVPTQQLFSQPAPAAPAPAPIPAPAPAPVPAPPPPPQQHQQESEQSDLPNSNSEVHDNNNTESQLPNHDDNDGDGGGDVDSGTFWTACPYCYHMYEYPKLYVECVLKCQQCEHAFHGAEVAPPPLIEGKDAYFCCWGYMPMGVSVKDLGRNGGGGGGSAWTPFSPMFTCPQMPGLDRSGNNIGRWRNVGGRKGSGGGPRIYIDDDDVFVEVSEPSEGESDDDWQKAEKMKKKKAKGVKAKVTPTTTPSKTVKKPQVEKGKNVKGGSAGNVQGGFVIQEGVGGMVNVVTAESSKKGPASNTRRQSGRAAKDFGKLDLNVEFSNEVEEPPPGMTQGNPTAGRGYEDNFEGTGFFEGLDEFLSSLPILNAVGGDDKVKAA